VLIRQCDANRTVHARGTYLLLLDISCFEGSVDLV
jgi:hypothetical protein